MTENNGFTYDDANRIATLNSQPLTYDDAGRLTNDGTLTYDWDRADRLLSTTDEVNDVSYTYNGLGQRIAQKVNGVEKTYLLDTQPALYKVLRRQQGANTTHYVHTPRGLHRQQQPDTSWVQPLMDGLGSVRSVWDSTLTPLHMQHYAPYGEGFGANGTEQTMFNFTGEPLDDNGLLHLRARYYMPELGVFPSLDPVEGGLQAMNALNRYAYVAGNVPNIVDPSGMIGEQPPVRCGFGQADGRLLCEEWCELHASELGVGVNVCTQRCRYGRSGYCPECSRLTSEAAAIIDAVSAVSTTILPLDGVRGVVVSVPVVGIGGFKHSETGVYYDVYQIDLFPDPGDLSVTFVTEDDEAGTYVAVSGAFLFWHVTCTRVFDCSYGLGLTGLPSLDVRYTIVTTSDVVQDNIDNCPEGYSTEWCISFGPNDWVVTEIINLYYRNNQPRPDVFHFN